MFGRNLKKVLTPAYMKQGLYAVLGAAVYTVLPTVLKMNGWGALAVGAGATFLLGVLLDAPGLLYGAVGMMALHLLYSHGGGLMQDLLNNSPWTLAPVSGSSVPTVPTTDSGGDTGGVMPPGNI